MYTLKYRVTTIKGNFAFLCQIDGRPHCLEPRAYNLPILQQYITLSSLLISFHSILNTLDSLQHSESCGNTQNLLSSSRDFCFPDKLMFITSPQLKLICQPSAHISKCGVLLKVCDMHNSFILYLLYPFTLSDYPFPKSHSLAAENDSGFWLKVKGLILSKIDFRDVSNNMCL